MAKKLQTIYEYFSNYSESEIDSVIYELSDDERMILLYRYGRDLHYPVTTNEWKSGVMGPEFYGKLIPKIKRRLENKKVLQEVNALDQTNVIEQSELPENHNGNVLVETPVIENVNKTSMLLQLLKDGKNNKELCEELDINYQQLYDMLLKLKNMGITHSRVYYSDGSIKYKNVTTMFELNNKTTQDRTIITPVDKNNLKLLVISDLHFGNELERLDLIDRAYNYCAKNGINIILCGGDLVDGSFSAGTQNISDLYQQIEYFIKNYPYDKDILTFSVAGNHDISVFRSLSLNLIEMCNNYRHDIIIGGYNNMLVNLKNDKIHLYHHIDGGEIRQTGAPIVLHGHSHKFSMGMNNNALNVTIPTLSGINQLMPSALELDLQFDKGYIVNSVIKHLYFGQDVDIILSESTFDLSAGRDMQVDHLRNVENFGSVLRNGGRSLIRRPSQIEKFNTRYGNRHY